MLICSGLILSIPACLAASNIHTYSTGDTLELDRCASAWLIKRFIDQKAVFRFFPEGSLITEGIAFDTADAKLTRSHNMSTFEVIMHKYNVQDQRVYRLAALIHDVEINFWNQKKHQRSIEVQNEVNRIIDSSEDNFRCLEECFRYFDHLIIELEDPSHHEN
jgi:hypothetical protein